MTVLVIDRAHRADVGRRCARRRPSSCSPSKHASARPSCLRHGRRSYAVVVPQVASGVRPFEAGCRVGSSSYNDPLNRVDPLGLRSTDAVFNVPNPCDPGPVTTEGQDYCNRYWPQDAASIIGYCGSSSVDWCFGWIGMSKYR